MVRVVPTEYRVDRVALRKWVPTPVGGLRIEAGMVKRGQVLEYRRADGTVFRELVAAEAAAAPVAGAPVTVGHPADGMVTPSTYRREAVGVVIGDVAFDDDLAVATLDVNDAMTIARVEAGDLREVSLGYAAEVVAEPGVAPDGQRYDAVQVARQVNHLALLPRGEARAGADAALRLDGAAVALDLYPMVTAMKKKLRIDAGEYEVGEDLAQAFDMWMAKRDGEMAAMRAERDAMQSKLDEVQKKYDELASSLEGERDEEEDPEEMDARADARLAVREAAIGLGLSWQGKSTDDLRREILQKLDGPKSTERFDGKPELLRTYFDGRVATGVSALGSARAAVASSGASDLSDYELTLDNVRRFVRRGAK